MKYTFDIGELVRIDYDAPAYGERDHSCEIGFITDRHPYPKGFEPPYDVDFGNGEIQSYYDYEFEPIYRTPRLDKGGKQCPRKIILTPIKTLGQGLQSFS